MKNNTIKVSGNKYQLNYSPIEIKHMAEAYNAATVMDDVRTIKSYFAEACLANKELKLSKNSFADLINLFTNKANQFNRLGATYVFGIPVKSIILHKAADTVKRTNPKIERELLAYIMLANRGKSYIDLEFQPGIIIRIKGSRSVEVLFDFRKNIRNY